MICSIKWVNLIFRNMERLVVVISIKCLIKIGDFLSIDKLKGQLMAANDEDARIAVEENVIRKANDYCTDYNCGGNALEGELYPDSLGLTKKRKRSILFGVENQDELVAFVTAMKEETRMAAMRIIDGALESVAGLSSANTLADVVLGLPMDSAQSSSLLCEIADAFSIMEGDGSKNAPALYYNDAGVWVSYVDDLEIGYLREYPEDYAVLPLDFS